MPTLESFDAAMRSANQSLIALPRLGGGQIVARDRTPLRVVGAEAAVYQLRQANGRTLALRCPFTDTLNPAIVDAWRRIATDPALAPLRTGTGAPLVSDITFVPDAISVPGPESRLKRYPLMAMLWLPAPALLTTVSRAAAAGDGAYLGRLADAWAALAERLDDADFAHGDLTADNILVRPGIELALVDYDTATWPGHIPGPISRTTTAYTHPHANASTDSFGRDPFAALVIYASLRVLADMPTLRRDHGGDGRHPNDALLFSANDLFNPARSELFQQIGRDLHNQETRALLQTLADATARAPEDMPPLPSILNPRRPRRTRHFAKPHRATTAPERRPEVSASAGRGAAPASSWAAVARPNAPVPAPERGRPNVDSDRVLSSDDTAGSAPEREIRTGPIPTPAPERLASRPQADLRHPATRTRPSASLVRAADQEQLERLLRRGEVVAALRHWQDHDLASDPESVARFGERIAAIEQEAAVGAAQEAAQRNDTVEFLRLWRRYRLSTFPPAERLRPIAEVAERRASAAERLRSALATRNLATVVRFWPSLKGDTLVADLAFPAADALTAYFGDRAGSAIAKGRDDELIAAIEDAEQHGVATPLEARRAFRIATNRVGTRERLDTALGANDRQALADLYISGRLAELGDVRPEVNRRALQALAWPHLANAFEIDRDDAIIGAYDPTLFAMTDGEIDPLSTRERLRVRLARRRQQWLIDVRDALRNRDTRSLGRAFADVPDGALDRLSVVEKRRIERLASREEAATNLAEAIQSGDDVAIVQALTTVASIGGSLPDQLDWAAVRGVVDRVTLADAIREAMAQEPPDAERLARLLPVARVAAAADPSLTDIDFAELEREVLRAAHMNRLRTALVTDDDDEIATAATPDPFGAVDRLPAAQRERVERALAARAKATGKAPKNRFIPTIYGSETTPARS